MRHYETMIVLRPDLTETALKEAIERSRRVIEGRDGHVTRVEEWGIRELAYPIHKQTHAHYVIVEYDAGVEAVREVERTLKIAEDVLRYVTVVCEPRSERPQRAAKAEALDTEIHRSEERT